MWGGCWGCRWRMTDKITKLIPGAPGMSLDKAMTQCRRLASLYNERSADQEDDRYRPSGWRGCAGMRGCTRRG